MRRNGALVVLCVALLCSAAAMPSPKAAAAPGDLFQDFNLSNTSAAYDSGVHVAPSLPPTVIDGGPFGVSKLLRLAHGSGGVNHNSISFHGPGMAEQVIADFDFRIQPGTGRADSLGFALLNTAACCASGPVDPQGPLAIAEEPDFPGSLGVDFDIYKSDEVREQASSDNHVSVHWNYALRRYQ